LNQNNYIGCSYWLLECQDFTVLSLQWSRPPSNIIIRTSVFYCSATSVVYQIQSC